MPPRVEGQLSDALISNLSDPAIGIDRLGAIRVMNEQAGRLFAVKPSEVMNQELLEVIPVCDFTRAFIQHVRDSSSPPTERVMVFPGDKVYAVSISSVRTERGRNLGAVAVLRDLAGVQKIERGLDEVLSDLSRRISVPLTSIKGFVETLLEGSYQDTAITRRFLQIINDETNRLVRLVMTLEESVNLNKEMVLNKTKVRLEDLLSSIVEMFAPIAHSKQVTIVSNIEQDMPWVDLDVELVRRALVNVVDNAVRFTGIKGQGCLTIAARQLERQVEITFSDTGVGISPQDLPKVFDRFYRGQNEPVASMGGTGLGLSVVKEVVEAHGGSVDIKSTLGQGTVLTMILPIR